MIYVTNAVPINVPGEPTLTRSDVWAGLELKANNALPFVPAMTHCEVLERKDELEFDREIEFRLDLLLFLGDRLCQREVLVVDPFVELDRVVDEVRVEVLDLLLRELDVVEPGDDLVVREEALLEPLLDQALELLDLGEGDIDRQHGFGFLLSRSNGY